MSMPTAAAAIYVPRHPDMLHTVHKARCFVNAQDDDTNCIPTICNLRNPAMVKAQTLSKDSRAVAHYSQESIAKCKSKSLRLSWRSYPAFRAPWALSQFPALSILSLHIITTSIMISIKMACWQPLLSVLLPLIALCSILTYKRQPHHGALKAFSAPLRRCTFMYKQ